jgi:hypothetical protein
MDSLVPNGRKIVNNKQTYKWAVPNVFLWATFCRKGNQEFKKLKMNLFYRVPVIKSEKESVKNCQKSTFGFQQVFRNREG